MKKSLLLLPLLSLPTFSLAEVRLYGTVKSGIEASRTQTGNDVRRSQTAVRDYGSHIGISGSFPLSGATQNNTDADAPLNNGSMRERLRRSKENRPMHSWAE